MEFLSIIETNKHKFLNERVLFKSKQSLVDIDEVCSGMSA